MMLIVLFFIKHNFIQTQKLENMYDKKAPFKASFVKLMRPAMMYRSAGGR